MKLRCRSLIDPGDVAAAVDTSGGETDISGCGRRKMARVSSANFGGGGVYIGRGS